MPTPPLDKLIAKLMKAAPGAEDAHLEATEWLYDAPPRRLPSIYRDFKQKFAARKAELAELLGEPARGLPADRAWFDRWYPECLHGAAWERDGKVICLAVEHQDRDAPVCLLLRCVTAEEIDELSA